ncbi:MAG: efflux RND transporter permease subunit [Gemmiger sp.]|uniref:efflux RND transporter permease subunit n=1 Tax=Gemmiger sp. TaxID=2049027 RepID=UPI002A910C8B|nr:efflux RND transporter permease subunit [Gemmiger sp.]MDY5327211.1 efflux RND transporter permease subunit [Gemmiger sp.]
MPKFSVKKPFTILVAVILVIVLGFVSLSGMQTDLLPNMNLPYLMVVTTYPGASPERVESDVTQPLESSLSTINGVKNVTSQSNENYSMIVLEFEDDTDMDSAMVKASTAINQMGDSLPDLAASPTLIEMSPDMMATQYVAVDCEGMDIFELSKYAEEEIIPNLERVNGVASISTTGLVEQTVQITLDQDKIDEVNDKLLVRVSDRLADAKKQLDDAQAGIQDGLSQLNKAQAELDSGKAELETQKKSITDQLRDAVEQLNEQIPALEQKISEMGDQLTKAQNQLDGLKADPSRLPELKISLSSDELASTRQILAQFDPQYNEEEMPADLTEAASDPVKQAAMIASIDRATASINGMVGSLTGGMTIDEASSALNQQIVGLSSQIQECDAQIRQLQQALESAADEETRAATQAQIEALQAQKETLEQQLSAAQTQKETLNTLDLALSQLELAKTALNNAALLVQTRQQVENEVNASLDSQRTALEQTIADLNTQIEKGEAMLSQLNSQRAQLESALQSMAENPTDPALADMAVQLLFSGTQAQISLGEFQISSGKTQLEAGQTQLDTAREEYESAREEALNNANLDQLLNMSTLAQLIGAQNFSMPAGYIEGGEGDDNEYILKVGDAFSSVDELGDMILCNIDGIGDVRLQDVANVEMVDNADDAYAKVGKNQAVLLAIYKSSTSSTSSVSKASNAAMEAMMEENPRLHLIPIMDQGDYIELIVKNVLSNLIEGAIFAVVVLALFLKDVRPTLVVAISMPLSVLFAIVLMYFTGINLNILSLSGLALGVGMLVDNSVVVIENIYRLRNRGLPAPRAAVQGARQVSGSIISSTLTTICVFLPLVFTTGMIMDLLSDMALTIGYSLIASLIVALTVVPCAGSTVLKKQKEIRHPWFDRLLNLYEKALRFCLNCKPVPIALAVGLLVFSVWQVIHMGIVLIPEMSTNQLSVTVEMPENTAKEDAFATADAVMDQLIAIDGIETVGAMSGGAATGAIAGMSTGSSTDNTRFVYYIVLNDEGGKNQAAIRQQIADRTADLPCEVKTSSGGMADMSSLTGGGLQIDVYGNNLEDLLTASEQVMEMLSHVDGLTEISNGQEESDAEVRIVINKDKAMRLGLTVAQVYQEIAKALTTDSTFTTLTVGSDTYDVSIVDNTRTPNLDDIFDLEFETTATDEDGNTVKETHRLGEFASRRTGESYASISRENSSRYISVTSTTMEGYNTTLISRDVEKEMQNLNLPAGCTAEIAGESTQVNDMVREMVKMMALALAFIYFIMVAQFQSLLSPFIVLFTIPLAFTGGMLGLLIAGEQLSLISLMGFLVLMGVVVNNGIVFVDYANQLRIGGLGRTEALVATGRTRMRPILMTTLTTVLAMTAMLLSTDPGSEMGKGMAIVVIGGLSYATLMTLFIVPVLYDTFYRRPPVNVDVGDDGLDDLPDDAAEFAAAFAERRRAQTGEPQPAGPAPQNRRLHLPGNATPDQTDEEGPQ